MATGKTLLVVGGGAAGFFCAVNAARLHPGLKVIIIEQSGKLLSKVRVSGGGRCNVTHACFDKVDMSKRYPRGGNFLKKAFHQFFTLDTIQWFEERGVKLKTEDDGRMFPVTNSSQTIIDCLLQEASKYKVEVQMQTELTGIEQNKNGQFLVSLSPAVKIETDFICIATGGTRRGKIIDILQSLGHRLVDPVPSLFTFNMPGHPVTKLMGISVADAQVKIPGTKWIQSGPLLITHWGISGPAVLKLSAWAARELATMKYEFQVQVNWLGNRNEQDVAGSLQDFRTETGRQLVDGKNAMGLPQRLWEFLTEQSGIRPGTRWADLPKKEHMALARNLCAYTIPVKGKTTFKEEFVTAGGVSLDEVDHNTMMSKKVPGLYFAGEVMDVDGITGGYNFQHAWTSGFIAARSMT